MQAYHYNAGFLCQGCGEGIRRELDLAGETPEHVDDERTFDSSAYPKGPFLNGGGLCDYPAHCDRCHVFLRNPLTLAGIVYLNDALSEPYDDNEVGLEWADFYSDVLKEE